MPKFANQYLAFLQASQHIKVIELSDVASIIGEDEIIMRMPRRSLESDQTVLFILGVDEAKYRVTTQIQFQQIIRNDGAPQIEFAAKLVNKLQVVAQYARLTLAITGMTRLAGAGPVD